ncbi:hypothetical protein EsH8_V_000557 [Colletotrichum jinshuiense]
MPDAEIDFIFTGDSLADMDPRVPDVRAKPASDKAKFSAVESGSLTLCGQVLPVVNMHQRGVIEWWPGREHDWAVDFFDEADAPGDDQYAQWRADMSKKTVVIL